MLEKFELIRELSQLFSGADIHLIPNTEGDIHTFLSQTFLQKFGASWGNPRIVQAISALDAQHIYEHLPFPGVSLLL